MYAIRSYYACRLHHQAVADSVVHLEDHDGARFLVRQLDGFAATDRVHETAGVAIADRLARLEDREDVTRSQSIPGAA